jgi:hypothetical protein
VRLASVVEPLQPFIKLRHMSPAERNRSPYPLLIDALRLLPVHPGRERDELGQARYRATWDGSGEVHGVPVRLEDLEELFIQHGGGVPRASPDGARVLLELFRAGILEVSRDRTVEHGVELLEAYAQGSASIIGPGYWARRPRRKSQRAVAPPFRDGSTSAHVASYNPAYRVTTHRLV